MAAPGEVITIQDAELTNSRGIAADFDNGIYWLANPADDGAAVVQGLYGDGSYAGQVPFDAELVDVQALAIFAGQLYVGDIGDREEERENIVVYRLDTLFLEQPAGYTQWTLTYPDGPHDAATMMVSPRGNIWIITREADAGLYFLAAPAGPGEYALQRVADAPAWVTDGTFIGPTTAALRTYTGLLTYDMSSYFVSAQAEAPAQPEGESLTESLDSDGLVVGSIGDERLLGVEVPQTMDELDPAPSVAPGRAATAPPAPSPTPLPSPAPTTQPPRDPLGTASGFTSGKTITAMAIAFMVSVAAGVLAYRRPRRI